MSYNIALFHPLNFHNNNIFLCAVSYILNAFEWEKKNSSFLFFSFFSCLAFVKVPFVRFILLVFFLFIGEFTIVTIISITEEPSISDPKVWRTTKSNVVGSVHKFVHCSLQPPSPLMVWHGRQELHNHYIIKIKEYEKRSRKREKKINFNILNSHGIHPSIVGNTPIRFSVYPQLKLFSLCFGDCFRKLANINH